MSDFDISKIREGVVVRPGDHLVITVEGIQGAKEVAQFAEKVRERLGPDIKVTVLGGVFTVKVENTSYVPTDGTT